MHFLLVHDFNVTNSSGQLKLAKTEFAHIIESIKIIDISCKKLLTNVSSH